MSNAKDSEPPSAAPAETTSSPEGIVANAAPAETIPALPAVGSLPNLPLPGATTAAIATPVAPAFALDDLPVTELPEIHPTGKSKPKTWLTKLAPSVIPPKTNFQYKRELLPEVIYATQYSRDNSHLPKRLTREDYANLLFTSVTKNDVDATRALLNAGTGLGVTNENGETPLMAAQRAGATEVAQLLVARGAK